MVEISNPSNSLDRSKMRWSEKPVVPTISEEKAANLYEEAPDLYIPGFSISAGSDSSAGSVWQLIKRRWNQPLVPIGLGCIAGSFVVGVYAMLRGNDRMSQLMMRYRVGFQTLTFAYLFACVWKISRDSIRSHDSAVQSEKNSDTSDK